MPQNISMAALVLGAVLLLLALSAGSFKIFGVEMSGAGGRWSRIIAGVIGLALIAFALLPNMRVPIGKGHGGAAMGELEMGTNRNRGDLDTIGSPAADAEACAELCRTDLNCRAMTYVTSQRWCWKKGIVPAATPNTDMISAVKVKH